MRWDLLAWLAVIYFVAAAVKGLIFDYKSRHADEELEEFYERAQARREERDADQRIDAERVKAARQASDEAEDEDSRRVA